MKTIIILAFLIQGSVLLSQDTSKAPAYQFVEMAPEYPGGTNALVNFLSANINYPEDARNAGIEGTVYVRFVIDSTGEVRDAKIMRGVSPSIDSTALAVVNLMPAWIPGRQEGKPVSVWYTIPVKFLLTDPVKKKKN